MNENGREALKETKAKLERMSKELSVIGISFGPSDANTMEAWSERNNAMIHLFGPFDPNFRDNIENNIQTLLNVDNVDGILIGRGADFKEKTLITLYKLATKNNFYLYATDRETSHFTESDFPGLSVTESEAVPKIQQVINYNVSGNQNVIATHGGINKQITNHLEIIQDKNPEIAAVLKDLAESIGNSSLEPKTVSELLQRIDDLSEEIGKQHPPERYWSIVDKAKTLSERIVTLVTLGHAGAFLREHADKLMPVIMSSFGQS